MSSIRSGIKIFRGISVRQCGLNDLRAYCSRSVENGDSCNGIQPKRNDSKTFTTLSTQKRISNSLTNLPKFPLLCRETSIERPTLFEIQSRSYCKKSNVRKPKTTRKDPCTPEHGGSTGTKEVNKGKPKCKKSDGKALKEQKDNLCGKKPQPSNYAKGKTECSVKKDKDSLQKKSKVNKPQKKAENKEKCVQKEDKCEEKKEDACKEKPKEEEVCEKEEEFDPRCKKLEREEPPCRQKTKEELRCEYDPSQATERGPEVIPCPVPTEDKSCKAIPYKLAPGELEAIDRAEPKKDCPKPKVLQRQKMCDVLKPEPAKPTDCFSKKNKNEEECVEEEPDPCKEKDPCEEETSSKKEDPCKEETSSKKKDPCKEKKSSSKEESEKEVCSETKQERPGPSCKSSSKKAETSNKTSKECLKTETDPCKDKKPSKEEDPCKDDKNTKNKVDDRCKKPPSKKKVNKKENAGKDPCNKEKDLKSEDDEKKCLTEEKSSPAPSCKNTESTTSSKKNESKNSQCNDDDECPREVKSRPPPSCKKSEGKAQKSSEATTKAKSPAEITLSCAQADADSKTLAQAIVQLIRKLLGTEQTKAQVCPEEDPCKKMFEEEENKKDETSKKKKKKTCKEIMAMKEKASSTEDKCEEGKNKEDPCLKEDPCKKEDPSKKEDPCKKEEDPCKKEEDPCKKEEDPCKKEEDPCKKEDGPCKKEEDPCKEKNEESKKNTCKKMKFQCPDFNPLKPPPKDLGNPPCEGQKEEDICEEQQPKKEDPCEEEKPKKKTPSKEKKTKKKKNTCKKVDAVKEKDECKKEKANKEDDEKENLCADNSIRDLIEIQMKNIFPKLSQKDTKKNKK